MRAMTTISSVVGACARTKGRTTARAKREGCLSREATTTLGGRRAMMMSMMSMMTMISAPRDARAETKEASHALEKLTRGIPDPWAEARRERARARARRRAAVDADVVAARASRERENERARAVYAEYAAKKKTRVRLERDGELGEEEIEAEAARAGREARERVERGTEAEEAELAAYERMMAERRATAEERNADFFERAEDVLEETGEADAVVLANDFVDDAGTFW